MYRATDVNKVPASTYRPTENKKARHKVIPVVRWPMSPMKESVQAAQMAACVVAGVSVRYA